MAERISRVITTSLGHALYVTKVSFTMNAPFDPTLLMNEKIAVASQCHARRIWYCCAARVATAMI
jgi:hypothetical protein